MLNRRFLWVRRCAFSIFCLAVLEVSFSPAAEVHYLAIGDSVTFGIDPSTPDSLNPSFGDQGFVNPFTDFLAQRHSGVRPTVNNLAIPGELSSSFFTGNAPDGWNSRVPALNLNYGSPAPSQHALMNSTIQSIRSENANIGYATLLLGSNDIFYLVTTDEFLAASPAEQQQSLSLTISGVVQGYQSILAELVVLAPEAMVLLPGYYNPYPDQTAEGQFYNSILDVFNPAVQQLATAFDATYIDLDSIFDGRELELTNIGIGDVHPNQAGYGLIADSFAQAVPEPTGIFFLASIAVIMSYRKALKFCAPKQIACLSQKTDQEPLFVKHRQFEG